MTEPRKTPRSDAMVMKCHGIPAEFVRGGVGEPRFVLAEDARALEIETQELADALLCLTLATTSKYPRPIAWSGEPEQVREMWKAIDQARATLARHRAKRQSAS